jgi:hydrogenase maturation protease
MGDEKPRVRVIGVGSPFGDDALGLAAARRLAIQAPAGVEVVAADRPGERLLDLFDGCAAVIVIDAAWRPAADSSRATGTVHELDLADAAAASSQPLSSHGLGVAQAIALAGVLGRLPPRGRFLAVEIDPVPEGIDRLSPAAEGALQRLWARVEHWLGVYCADSPPARGA